MTTSHWLRAAELLLVALLVTAVVVSWQADRRDRAQLAAQLAAAQQTIAEAAARQKDRDAALSQTLSQIADLKQSVVTPAQLLKALPQALALPQPITLKNAGAQGSVGAQHAAPQAPPPDTNVNANVGARFGASPSEARATNPSAPADLPTNPAPKSSAAPDAVIPSADLKRLYDFALDCKACQAKLAAAQNDLADERTKSAALTQQRDAAIRTAKGGSALRRIARAAKWFILGAAAGALAARAR